jgi:hypothetical protein
LRWVTRQPCLYCTLRVPAWACVWKLSQHTCAVCSTQNLLPFNVILYPTDVWTHLQEVDNFLAALIFRSLVEHPNQHVLMKVAKLEARGPDESRCTRCLVHLFHQHWGIRRHHRRGCRSNLRLRRTSFAKGVQGNEAPWRESEMPEHHQFL